MNEIDPADAYQLAAEATVLLDVRDDEQWARGHAPAAIHMPLDRLDPSALEPGVPVATICRAGRKSAVAAEQLAAAGFTTTNVTGGMLAWAAAGLPVVDSDGAAGVVAE